MSRRWIRVIGAADIVVLGLAAGMLFLRNVGTVTVEEALQRFRAATASEATPLPPTAETKSRKRRGPTVRTGATATRTPAASRATDGRRSAPLLPREGVYLYRTEGSEKVNMPGGQHEYPDVTTITVRHAGCGVINRWDALAQRWDERETCPSGTGEVLRSLISYHEFFRHGERLVYRCDSGSLARPESEAPPGTTWNGSCHADDSRASFRGVIIGREALTVNGVTVDTIRIRVDTSITGNTTGTNVHEDWVLPATGQIVREISVTEADVRGPFGTVRYEERYELVLDSLEPRT